MASSPLMSKEAALPVNYGATLTPTDTTKGLTSAEVEQRLAEFGRNELEAEAKVGFFTIFVLQMKNVFFLLTAVASVICYCTGDQLKARFFMGLVIFVCFFNAVGEYTGQDAAAELKKINASATVVIRDGVQESIDTELLVPDDIVIIGDGEIVPADIQVVEIIKADLQTNEAILTGEPSEMTKTIEEKESDSNYKSNMLYKGTAVICGKGKGRVIATGMRTEVGLIAKRLPGGPKDINPLQQSINILGNRIMMACGCVIAIGATACISLEYQMLPPKCAAHDFQCLVLDSSVRGLLMAIAIIPHGLPLVVMVMMRVAAKKMSEQGGVVTRQTAVDYLGAATYICTDKTGTLTEGKMAAKLFTGIYRDPSTNSSKNAHIGFYPMKGLNPEGKPYPNRELSAGTCKKIEGGEKVNGLHDLSEAKGTGAEYAYAQTVLAAAFLNAKDPEIYRTERDGWLCKGNMSDAALKVAAMKGGYAVRGSGDCWEETVEAKHFRDEHSLTYEVGFSAKRKMSATVHELVSGQQALKMLSFDKDTTHYAIVKGAPDRLFPKISAMLQYENGQLVFSQQPATDQDRKDLERRNKELSDEALRTIIMAIRPLKKAEVDSMQNMQADDQMQLLLETPLALLGLWAIYDPPRSSVPPAIERCHRAGIEVVMITGDQPSTALAIGRKVGLTEGSAFANQSGMSKDQDLCKHCSELHEPEVDIVRQNSKLGLDGLQASRSYRVHDSKSTDDSHEKEYKDDRAINDLTKDVRMWARAMPTDKLCIVESLQDQGQITAMTGDGVNDAPALQHAHIGVAMGISGTAVTRNAAALILQDDDFSTIVAAIEEGRKIYGNLQKYVLFNLSVKASECLCILVAIFFGFCIPVQGMQQLTNLLFTHIIPPMALAWEDSEWYTMQVPPRNTKTDLILNRMHFMYRWLPFITLYAVIVMTNLNMGVWMNTGFVKVQALIGSAHAGAVQAGDAACEIAGHLDEKRNFIADSAPFHCRCEVRQSLWQARPEVRDQWGRVDATEMDFDRWTGSAGNAFDFERTPFAHESLLHRCTDVKGLERMCWNNAAETRPLLGIRNNCAEAGGRLGITMGYVSVQVGEILALATFRTDCFFAHARRSRVYLGMLALNLSVLMCVLYVPAVTDFLDLAPLDFHKLSMALVAPLVLLCTAEGIKAVYNQEFGSFVATKYKIFPPGAEKSPKDEVEVV